MTVEIKLQLTEEDLAAIGHVVADPKAWAEHAFENIGAAAIRAKIAKYQEEYEAARAALGAAYKTRAERDADEAAAVKAARQAKIAEKLQAVAEEEAKRDVAFQSAVAEAVRQEFAAKQH